MKISSIIVTTLFMGAASIIAATLFTSDKGLKTRRKMERKGKLYKDYLVDNLYDLADSVSHPFENLEEETMRLSKKANERAKEIKTEINQRKNG